MKGRRLGLALVAQLLGPGLLSGCGRSEVESVPLGTDTDGDSTSGSGDGNCGNAVVDPGEACDPGESQIGPGQACLPGCVENVCGDGDVGPDESCDDGNADNNDDCRNDCVLGTCNNGVVDPGEACDDGNFDDTDDCLSTCRLPSCGDGFVQTGVEECDDGRDLNEPSGSCTPECALNVCGDGYRRFDEECDPGADQIGPGQACRDGCVQNVCGDGDVWGPEACDDGNNNSNDACIGCIPATCGDSFVWEGEEDCEDGNSNDLDACRNDCTFHRVTQIAMGGNHTCVLLNSQQVLCWGNGDNGRTGHGNEENYGDDEPAWAGGFLSTGGPVERVVAGIGHTCLHYAGAGLRCFGRAEEGQLGYGSLQDLGDDEVPSELPFVLNEPTTLVNSGGGAFHTCALGDTTGELRCWGDQSSFQLGLPGQTENLGDDEPASDAPPVSIGSGPLTQLAAGNLHSCALLRTGDVRCWGSGLEGRLGYGNTETIGDDETPAFAGAVPIGQTVTRIAAGWNHTCALTDDGDVYCWGRGASGRLGYGNTVNIGEVTPPISAGPVNLDSDATAVDVVAGLAHTCALFDSGAVRCWGANTQGQLGYGNTNDIGDNETAGAGGDVSLGGAASALAADGNQTCAVLEATGAVRCWGSSGEGRLGYGNTNDIGDDEPPSAAGDVPLFP